MDALQFSVDLRPAQNQQYLLDLQERIEFWDMGLLLERAMLPAVCLEKLAKGEMTCEEADGYLNEFRRFRLRCQTARIAAKARVLQILPNPSHDLYYEQYGIGHCDDMDYIPHAWGAGFFPRIYDISSVALSKGKRKYEEIRIQHSQLPEVEQVVQFGDLILRSKEGVDCFEASRTLIIDVSRLIHHFDQETRKIVLTGLGRLFSEKHREIDITVPLEDKNPGYNYVRGVPITRDDIMQPLQEGAGKDLVIDHEGPDLDFNYCGGAQVYTFLPIVAGG